jgi:hypothetical protein
MIDFSDKSDRAACRDAIARALDMTSPEAAMAVLWRYGEAWRDELFNWSREEDDAARDNEITQTELRADAFEEAYDCLMEDVDQTIDDLNDGKSPKDIAQKLYDRSEFHARGIKSFR